METQIIGPEPELRLSLLRAPDDPPLFSPEYQKELEDFAESLQAQGVEVRAVRRAFDGTINGAAGGDLLGQFVLMLTALGGAAAVSQLRKLVEGLIGISPDRKIKITNGSAHLEGTPRDLKKLLTPEQIEKLLNPTPPEPKPRKKIKHG